MTPRLLHLHTYFLFPFVIDKEVIADSHPGHWSQFRHWLDGLDGWIASEAAAKSAAIGDHLGGWHRVAYERFDMDSSAYRDMVFFHPYVRRVFFDTRGSFGDPEEQEALIRCYVIPLEGRRRLFWTAEDSRGRSSTVQVTDIRIFLFANGLGILSLGVEASDLEFREALWINEMMRKVYPSSGRQRREGRMPARSALYLEDGDNRKLVVEENFAGGDILGFQPPLSSVITSLLYFMDYDRQEYEQVLDERMIAYSYAAVDPSSVPEDFLGSEQQEVMVSRFLYIDRYGADFRYDPDFQAAKMKEDLYRRWAREGTFYGFTSYSNITWTLGVSDRGEHLVEEGALIHRMFASRYYLMAIISLFYRATLLDFAEKLALVSRRLYQDLEVGNISRENFEIANDLRSEFLHFSNYWYFDELANKDEEIEHFTLQCNAYRLESLRTQIEQGIEKLNASLMEYNQVRSTEAVNRLAMLSMIMGAGAVLTGYFGMNFGREFQNVFFEAKGVPQISHYAAIVLVTVLALGSIFLGVYLIAANWRDYRDILRLRRSRIRDHRWYSLRKCGPAGR